MLLRGIGCKRWMNLSYLSCAEWSAASVCMTDELCCWFVKLVYTNGCNVVVVRSVCLHGGRVVSTVAQGLST